MKQNYLLIIAIAFCFQGFAQKGKVNAAQASLDLKDVKAAYASIQKAFDTTNVKVVEKVLPWAKAWLVRGDVYLAIYNSKDNSVKALVSSEDALNEAYRSYQKVFSLDYTLIHNDLILNINGLRTALSDKAVEYYNNKAFDQSAIYFDKLAMIESYNDIVMNFDSSIAFNAGLTGYLGKNYELALRNFRRAIGNKYKLAESYAYVIEIYKVQQDKEKVLQALEEAITVLPTDKSIVLQLVNFFLENEPEKSLSYVEKGLEVSPNNELLHFAKGIVYERLENEPEAISSYEKAISIKPDYGDALFNLGAIFYNKGISIVQKANELPHSDVKTHREYMERAKQEFIKAQPYFESAYCVTEDNQSIGSSLERVYYQLQLEKSLDSLCN